MKVEGILIVTHNFKVDIKIRNGSIMDFTSTLFFTLHFLNRDTKSVFFCIIVHITKSPQEKKILRILINEILLYILWEDKMEGTYYNIHYTFSKEHFIKNDYFKIII